ncbi:MAG: hypothetical protein CM1200mP20_03120 [Pseudomonadota bacterium]|nr:MAG: hypothetical protein CM1200mP20_03120 [Pseudomonadota bacterium]
MKSSWAGAIQLPALCRAYWCFPAVQSQLPDSQIKPASGLNPDYTGLMGVGHSHSRARTLALTAIRETWEETGMMLGVSGHIKGRVADPWRPIVDLGLLPDLEKAALRRPGHYAPVSARSASMPGFSWRMPPS